MHITTLISAAITLLGALVVLRWMPGRAVAAPASRPAAAELTGAGAAVPQLATAQLAAGEAGTPQLVAQLVSADDAAGPAGPVSVEG
jgi:hypothetical protein